MNSGSHARIAAGDKRARMIRVRFGFGGQNAALVLRAAG